MARHLIRIVGAAALVVLCMMLPYLPGGYDSFAVILSGGARLVAFVGPLLVPIGAAWLVYELRRRGRQRDGSTIDKRYYFAIVSVVASSLLVGLLALAAFAGVGPSLGTCVLAIAAYGLRRVLPRVKRMKHEGTGRFMAAPLYLLCIPAVATLSYVLLLGPATELSRRRAIANSVGMIHEIEEYHRTNGRYPVSLLALLQDYRPGVIGVERFYYEPNGDAYDLFFEQLSDRLGTREIVMYNTRGEHSLPSHDTDLLRWTPEQQRARPGHYALTDASIPHWKLFWFD